MTATSLTAQEVAELFNARSAPLPEAQVTMLKSFSAAIYQLQAAGIPVRFEPISSATGQRLEQLTSLGPKLVGYIGAGMLYIGQNQHLVGFVNRTRSDDSSSWYPAAIVLVSDHDMRLVKDRASTTAFDTEMNRNTWQSSLQKRIISIAAHAQRVEEAFALPQPQKKGLFSFLRKSR